MINNEKPPRIRNYPMSFNVLSWNVAGRVNKFSHQLNAVLKQDPDVIALQEVIQSTKPLWLEELSEAGYFSKCSFDLVDNTSILQYGRKYGVIIASKWAIEIIQSGEVNIPWQERLLSVTLKSPWGQIIFHNIHMPAGVSHGDIKHQTFEGLYRYLAHTTDCIRILCGDFNSPRKEYPDGRVVTWGKSKQDGDGRLINDLSDRQASAEQSIFTGLSEYDLIDIYRKVNAYTQEDYSWIHKWRDHRTYRRFDHIFASSKLKPERCQYLHELLDQRLSDHAPIFGVFLP